MNFDGCYYSCTIPKTFFDTPDGDQLTQADDNYDFRGMAQQYILDKLLADYDPTKPNAKRQYLLQHADWVRSDRDSDDDNWVFVAVSDISDRGGYADWPLYSLDISIRAPDDQDSKLSIVSWKGDFDTIDDYDPPSGSLHYRGPRCQFVGTIWCRG